MGSTGVFSLKIGRKEFPFIEILKTVERGRFRGDGGSGARVCTYYSF